MAFLTPVGGLVALAALLPLGAVFVARARTEIVRRRLDLPAPGRSTGIRPLLAAAAIALLGLAAVQPVLARESRPRSRSDVQALFVLDVSRSMAASHVANAPTRLDRAAAAAIELRNAIPDVPAGVLTLTDRVLPNLLPVPDRSGFAGVVDRAVRIESPPPQQIAVRATSYSALSQIATGNAFSPNAKRRVVVLLTDGESGPFAAGAVAHALSGYDFEAVRFWKGGESVFDPDGSAEAAYRPDPSGRAVLHDLASSLGGRSYEEDELRPAAAYLRSLAGSGPTVAGVATGQRRLPLAPYVALLALVLLLILAAPRAVRLTRQ
jgi:von Willebrand factor type A domain